MKKTIVIEGKRFEELLLARIELKDNRKIVGWLRYPLEYNKTNTQYIINIEEKTITQLKYEFIQQITWNVDIEVEE
jgi:hypothetical protein